MLVNNSHRVASDVLFFLHQSLQCISLGLRRNAVVCRRFRRARHNRVSAALESCGRCQQGIGMRTLVAFICDGASVQLNCHIPILQTGYC